VFDGSSRKAQVALKELPNGPVSTSTRMRRGRSSNVGKARNLRNRVQSYLVRRGARDARIMTLINEIDAIDFVLRH